MKITKADLDAFWAALHAGGANFYEDDTDQEPEDDSDLAPGDTVTITCGVIGWQDASPSEPDDDGKQVVPTNRAREVPGIFTLAQVRRMRGDDSRAEPQGLCAALRRFLRSRTCVTLSVEVPKEKESALREWVKANGWKVL